MGYWVIFLLLLAALVLELVTGCVLPFGSRIPAGASGGFVCRDQGIEAFGHYLMWVVMHSVAIAAFLGVFIIKAVKKRSSG